MARRDGSEYSLGYIVRQLGEVYGCGSAALWLDSPNLDLCDARPIDLCATEAGRLRVAEVVDLMVAGHA